MNGADEPRGGEEDPVPIIKPAAWAKLLGKIHKWNGKNVRVCDHCSYTNPADKKTCVICDKPIGGKL